MKKFFNKIIPVSACAYILLGTYCVKAMDSTAIGKENVAQKNLEIAQDLYTRAWGKISFINKIITGLAQDPTTRTAGTLYTLSTLKLELSQLIEHLSNLTKYDAQFDMKFKLNLQKNDFFARTYNLLTRANVTEQDTLQGLAPIARVEYSLMKYMQTSPENLTVAERQTMLENITMLNTLFNERVLHDEGISETIRMEFRAKLIALARRFARN